MFDPEALASVVERAEMVRKDAATIAKEASVRVLFRGPNMWSVRKVPSFDHRINGASTYHWGFTNAHQPALVEESETLESAVRPERVTQFELGDPKPNRSRSRTVVGRIALIFGNNAVRALR